MYTEIIFDIETKKLFQDIDTQDPADLGVSIVSLYLRQLDSNYQETEGKIYSFWEADFPKMFELFKDVDRIIGYNSLKFDVPALIPHSPYDFTKLKHYDLLEEIRKSLGFRISLANLTQSTLNHSKIDVGTNAVLYWNEATKDSLAKLQKYCEADVMVTKEVYDYAFKYGQLKYLDRWNTPRVFDLKINKPQKEAVQQSALF